MRGLFTLLMAVGLNQHHVRADSLRELCLRNDIIGILETLRHICREYFQHDGECLRSRFHRCKASLSSAFVSNSPGAHSIICQRFIPKYRPTVHAAPFISVQSPGFIGNRRIYTCEWGVDILIDLIYSVKLHQYMTNKNACNVTKDNTLKHT